MTVCEQCGGPIATSWIWEALPSKAPRGKRLVWLHVNTPQAQDWDHDAEPAPELPLEGQEGTQEP